MGRTTGAKNHTHRYILKQMGTSRINLVWRCSLTGCSHFLPGNADPWGRMSICWECGVEFPMDDANEKRYGDMPKCEECLDRIDRGESYAVRPKELTIVDLIPPAPPPIHTGSDVDNPEEIERRGREKEKDQLKQRIEQFKNMREYEGAMEGWKKRLKELENM